MTRNDLADIDDDWAQWIEADDSVELEFKAGRSGSSSSDRTSSFSTEVKRGLIVETEELDNSWPYRSRNASLSSTCSTHSVGAQNKAQVLHKQRRRRQSTHESVLSPKNEALLKKIMEVNNISITQKSIAEQETELEPMKKSRSITTLMRKFSSTTMRKFSFA